jgi:large subunit ribosomal protein L7/L12
MLLSSSSMTVLELSEMVKELEEKIRSFRSSGCDAVMAGGGALAAEAPKGEEKTEFNVILASRGR